MGWLREYMSTVQPPISSFGKLAAVCLEHPGWPEGPQPKDRSLATLFSKLDREKDLDWLRDRPEVQQVLAQVLKRPLSDLRATLGDKTASGSVRFLRLIDVRFAREIDLGKEELPPGLPREVLSPPNWNSMWWVAPSGSGRSMAGRWLETRGLAHVVFVRERASLLRAPERGPLFIEIASTSRADDFLLGENELQYLRLGQRPVCIAAPFEPTSRLFERVDSPHPSAYLPELIDWIESRLDGRGHFQANRAEGWMSKVAIPSRAVTTLGDALGLLGMLDEVHPRSLLAKSLDDIGEHFVRRRVREGAEDSRTSPRLADTAYETLKECAARVLVAGKNELLTPHPVDEWTNLLASPDEADSPDPEWFHQALRGTLGSQISRRDLKRATKSLPPTSFQLARHLETAGLLVRDTSSSQLDESYRTLHPHWLVSLLTARATQEVLRLAPSQWGRVLWTSRRADDIVVSLHHYAERDDWSPFFAVLDDFDEGHPELIAALEGATIALGHCALEGMDLPEDLSEGFLATVAESVMLLDQLPHPRTTASHCSLFHRDQFLTALAALCAEAPFPLRKLDPFRSEDPRVLEHFKNATIQVLSAHPPEKRAVGIIQLQDALFPTGTPLRPSALTMVDSMTTIPEDLSASALAECPLEILIAYVKSTERSHPTFVRDLWNHMGKRPQIAPLFRSSEALKEFWRAAPTTIVMERMKAGTEVLWSALLPHQFSDILESDHAPNSEIGRYCPLEPMITRIEKRGATSVPGSALRAVIERSPGRFVAPIVKSLRDGDIAGPRHFFKNTPPSCRSAIASALPPASEILSWKPGPINEVRTFLHTSCQTRDPGFEESYERLTELERGLAPLKRLI